MDHENLKNFVLKIAPEATFTENKQFPEAIIPAAAFHDVCLKLVADSETSFDYLFDLTAVDWKDHFMLVYHLASTSFHHTLVLKVRLDERQNPAADTVSDIWKSADPFEREVFDLFGIRFRNHPNLTRLFMDEGYGFPLRKDFTDPVRIIER